MNPNDSGLLLGSNGIADYKWIQSYSGNLIPNPVGNNAAIRTSTPDNSSKPEWVQRQDGRGFVGNFLQLAKMLDGGFSVGSPAF